MFEIKHIDHLVLRVKNIEPMLFFYVNILGGSVDRIKEDLGLYQIRLGVSLIDLVTVDGELGLLGGAAPGAEGKNLDHLCLKVEPFHAEEIIAYLRINKLKPEPVAIRYGAEGYGPSIYVADPEGNTVELKGPSIENAEDSV